MKKIRLHWWILLGMGFGFIAGAIVHGVHGPEVAPTTGVYQAFDGLLCLVEHGLAVSCQFHPSLEMLQRLVE